MFDTGFSQGARNIDFVGAAGEILDQVGVLRRGFTGLVVDEDVRPAASAQLVCPPAPLEAIVCIIAGQHIIACTADGIFQGHALGDGNITFHSPDVRE